ncbi:deacetylase [Idiomarina sp. OT37-5b]|jgi:acetoin utilization deacetylase AcuC-like enzyme|uniref:histone deacetylase family protein n=1 Tax=Idiomarina sp. OT37-5b TaxID=2100422 RepID=UPI000CFA6A36|nr:histone deacetylase family protein [Idiomarina sp. OT37-5b]AVJ56938.1 deacetylase [Idiomarina sp. OT37-5b]
MSITLFSHKDCALHNPDPHHPECPARLDAINDQIIRSGLDFVIVREQATASGLAPIYQVHDRAYVDDLFAKVPADGHIWLDPDTPMTSQTLTSALMAVGANINAVDHVMSRTNHQAFCAVRPPGHHATRNQAMGFCVFNNIAIAARYAIDHYGLERVAIVDFDVHHGNGTEDIFEHDPRVLFCSSFQQQLYPFVDENHNNEHILSIGLPPGCKNYEWREAVYQRWFPKIDAFKPQLILISAGFDGHIEDEMSQFLLKEDDYYWVTEQLKRLADKHCQGRIVSTLEGGYALSALGRSVVAHLKGMLGSDAY